jgi:hypothetical protein
MDNRIAPAANPRNFGKPLRHDKFGLPAANLIRSMRVALLALSRRVAGRKGDV